MGEFSPSPLNQDKPYPETLSPEQNKNRDRFLAEEKARKEKETNRVRQANEIAEKMRQKEEAETVLGELEEALK